MKKCRPVSASPVVRRHHPRRCATMGPHAATIVRQGAPTWRCGGGVSSRRCEGTPACVPGDPHLARSTAVATSVHVVGQDRAVFARWGGSVVSSRRTMPVARKPGEVRRPGRSRCAAKAPSRSPCVRQAFPPAPTRSRMGKFSATRISRAGLFDGSKRCRNGNGGNVTLEAG